MAIYRYTAEQLLHLKESPLVQKPATLPSIEQWIDPPQEQNQRKPRNPSIRTDEAAPMGNFASTRPSLLQTRQMSRSATGEDIVLGPPKMSFASSRNTNRITDAEGGASQTGVTDDTRDADVTPARSRFFRDKDEQAPAKGAFNTNSRDKESWTAGRGIKTFGGEDSRTGFGDEKRFSGRNLRDRGDRSIEGEDDGRRNGYGQRPDQRWSRDGDRVTNRPSGQERGGWRDREKQRPDREWERERERERGGHTERDPEWMDEPTPKEEETAHTADEFEKWKAKMRAGKDKPQEKEVVQAIPVEMAPAQSKPSTSEAGFDRLFAGSWADTKRSEGTVEQPATPAKAPAAKGKSSRFASLFAPKEEVRPPADTPASPAAGLLGLNGSNEDKEGFARMLNMLRGTSVGAPTNPLAALMSPPIQTPTERVPSAGMFVMGADRKGSSQLPPGLLPGMLDKRSSMHQQDRPDSSYGSDVPFGLPAEKNGHGGQSMNDGVPGSKTPIETQQPRKTKMSNEQRHSRRPDEMQSVFVGEPTRKVSTPDINIQALLAAQRPTKTPALNKDSEFLLNLIQTKKSDHPSPQPRPPQNHDGFQLFLDQPPKHHSQPQTHAPQPRAPPPGFLQDQIFMQREPHPNVEQSPEHQIRQQIPRPPPGFYDDPSIIQHQPQHFGGEPGPQRRQQPGQLPFPPMGGPFPPEGPFMGVPQQHGPPDRMPLPPPGFAPNMRHPQGFANIPGIFQQQRDQPPPPNQYMGPMPPHLQQRPGPLGGPGPGPISGMNDGPPGFGLPPPPGFFGGPNHGPGLPAGFPPMPGMMRGPPLDGMRSPQEPMSVGGMSRGGFEGFPGLGQPPRR